MKWIFFLALGASLLVQAESVPAGKEISGVVRVIRGQPETEVFFKDLKDSVIIPRNSHHNQIYEACETSWKKGTPVKLVIDPVSRRALSLPGASSSPASASSEADHSTESSTLDSNPGSDSSAGNSK